MKNINVLEILGIAIKGGVESYLEEHCSLLDEKYKLTFVCFDDSPCIDLEIAKRHGWDIELVPNIKHYLRFKKALKSLMKKKTYDIVHSHINTLSVFPLKIVLKE